MSEQVCENCQKLNPAEETYCYACAHILPAGMQAISTHSLDRGQSLQPQLRWGTAYFGDQSILRIHIRHTGSVIEMLFREECILGRTVGNVVADVDLTAHGGMEMGVSRHHAKLTRQSATIMVQDLGSVNGTFLNGQKLLPHQPRVLRNEDELSLGHLVLRISFAQSARLPNYAAP